MAEALQEELKLLEMEIPESGQDRIGKEHYSSYFVIFKKNVHDENRNKTFLFLFYLRLIYIMFVDISLDYKYKFSLTVLLRVEIDKK